MVVAASIRSLARDLGVSKNTVHRSLLRLRAAGMLVDLGQQRGGNGRFAASVYRLDVSTDVIAPFPEMVGPSPSGAVAVVDEVAEERSTPADARVSPRRVRSAPRRRVVEQLSLLPEA